MSEFMRVARVQDLPEAGKLTVEFGDHLLLLVRVAGQIHCLDDVCTHDGGPLGEGPLCGHEIVCPRHGARFDVRDGRAVKMPATEATRVHEVRVDGDDILVKLAAEA